MGMSLLEGGTEMQMAPAARRLGRPRKSGMKRDRASGRARGETPAEAMATVKAQRVKLGAPRDDASNALYGTTIGLLHRRWQLCETNPCGLSTDQYNAAQTYIATVFHYCELMGIPLPWPGGAASRATRGDPDEETVLRVRRRFADFRRALLDCGAALGLGCRVNAAVYRVCIEDPHISTVRPREIELLQFGLNALARLNG